MPGLRRGDRRDEVSEPYMKWQDELCGLCKHSHQSHGATDGGRCRVRGCLCSKFNEVIERDQAIHELEAVIDTLRAQNRELMAALEKSASLAHRLSPSGERVSFEDCDAL